MVDVVIVGAGIAGSVLATLLGRNGFSVELFEQGRFPKEKPCGEGLMPGGVAALARMGLDQAGGGTPFYGVNYHLRDLTFECRFPSSARCPGAGRGQRRKDLDQALFRAATSTPGVTAFTNARVDGPVCENGRVVGVRVDGESRRAALVVAADGVNSRFRHRMGLNKSPRRNRFGVCTHFRLAPGQEQSPWADVFVSKGYELYVTPLPDGEVLVAGMARARTLTQPIESLFHDWWSSQPILAARLEGATQISPLLATSPLSVRAKAGVAPGLVLLGDAAGSVDPITGSGMTLALLSAELLAKHINGSLVKRNEQWLWQFDRERQSLLRDHRFMANLLLCMSHQPRLAYWLLSGMKISPALCSHLMGITAGVRKLWWKRAQANAAIYSPTV